MGMLISYALAATISFFIGVVIACKGIAVADEEQRNELESLCARIDTAIKKLWGGDL